MPDPMASMGREFSRQLGQFRRDLSGWRRQSREQTKVAYRRFGAKAAGQAKRRVPVGELPGGQSSGRLQQGIIHATFEERGDVVTEVGTNVTGENGEQYPLFLEMGTDRIAGGQVKQQFGEPAGFPAIVTDAEAVKSWPAKDEGTTGGPRQQMPWLRPSLHVVLPEAIRELNQIHEPPRQRGA